MAAYFHQPSRGLRAEGRRGGGAEKRRSGGAEEYLCSSASSLHCTVGPARGHLAVLASIEKVKRETANGTWAQRRKQQDLYRVCLLPRDRQRPLWRHIPILNLLCVSWAEGTATAKSPQAMSLLSGDRSVPHRREKLLSRLSRRWHSLQPRTCRRVSCLRGQRTAQAHGVLLLAVPGKGSGRPSLRDNRGDP